MATGLTISNLPPAPPVHRAQPMRDVAPHPDGDRDAYGRSDRSGGRRGRPESGGPEWPYEDWPLPFASFWTSVLMMGLAYPARSLFATLFALGMGLWLGVRLDRWLRRHPGVGGPRIRFLLGVS